MGTDTSSEVTRQLDRIGGDFNRFVAAQKQRTSDLDTRTEQILARLTEVEQKASRPAGDDGRFSGAGQSIGAKVEAAFHDTDARDLLKKTGRLSLDINAAITTAESGGYHRSLDVPIAPATPGSTLASLLNPGDLNGATVLHYTRKVGSSGGAGVQAGEGAAKPSAEPTFAPQTQNVLTIAGFATVSEQALNAAGGLQRAVDSFLRKSVMDALDTVLIDGTAVTAWPFAGFEALAATLTAGAGYTSILDALISGATRMRLNGFAPSIAVLPEAAFLQTQLAKGSDGHYMLAANLLRDAGLTLAISGAIAAGKALLLDPRYANYLSSGTTRVSIGYINDGFQKNLVSLRAELEVAPYLTDTGAALEVTPAAS